MKASAPHEGHASFTFICQGQGYALRNVIVHRSQSSVTQRGLFHNSTTSCSYRPTCAHASPPTYPTGHPNQWVIQRQERGLRGKSRALPLFTQHLLCLLHCCHCGGACPQRSWLLHSVNETGNDRTLYTEGRLWETQELREIVSFLLLYCLPKSLTNVNTLRKIKTQERVLGCYQDHQ